MAEPCPDLARQIAEAEATVAAAEKLDRAAKAKEALLHEAPDAGFRTFSMVDGTKVRVNPMDFYKQVERLNLDLGEEEIKQMARSLFDKEVKPNGGQGMNINYADLDPSDETFNQLLLLMGQKRSESAGGRELMMPFTTEVASNELMMQMRVRGGNAELIARGLADKQGQYRKLPMDMMMSKYMKKDATRYLADQLEEYGELMETIGISDLNKARIARSAQYAYFFEQVDALLARKVSQALRSRGTEFSSKLDATDLFEEFEINYEDVRLTLDKIEEGSLASQILNAIETGNAKELKKIATLKRLNATHDIPINESNVMTQVRLLNAYRKANLFSSPSTWVSRNVVSGALVNSSYMMEDVYEGAFRVGVGDGFKAAQYARGQTYQGFNTAWANAMSMLNTGDAKFTKSGLIEGVDAADLRTRKIDAENDLNSAWERVIGTDGQGYGPSNVVATMNLLNAGARVFLGRVIERTPGTQASTAGYSPSFTLLAAGDEVNSKMAFDWKAHHESYIQAVEEWKQTPLDGVTKSEWVSNRANKLAEKASFSGLMTDDELVSLRRRVGGDQYSDMDNETIRLQLFNDRAGMPNPGNPIGKKALDRGSDITFTAPLKDKVFGGFNQMRSNPFVGWMVPVFQTPINGLKWTISRDLMVNMAEGLYRESRQGIAKMQGKSIDDLPYSASEMSQARARALNSAFIALATNALWETGVFSDGGPFNAGNNDQQRGQNPPYSFSLGGTAAVAFSKLRIPGASIDLVDLMGLQADVMRAFSEGLMTEGDQSRLMDGIVRSYANAIDNKSSLRGVMEIMTALTDAKRRGVAFGKLIRSNMNGVFPLSGALTSGSRGFTEADMMLTDRRAMSTTELAAIGKDPNYALFEDFTQTILRGIPLLGLPGAKLRHRDWMGRKRQKPLGLPWDQVAPFAPIIVQDTPLDKWMAKHGFGGVPNSDGVLSQRDTDIDGKGPGQGSFATMSIEEENDYREGMWSVKGGVEAVAILGKSNAYIDTRRTDGVRSIGAVYDVNSFVQGRTMEQALTALSEDPQYNADLNTPNSPSLTRNIDQPINERSLSKRTAGKGRDPRGIGKVYSAIIDYYSWHGAQQMMQKHPDYTKKLTANYLLSDEAMLEDIGSRPLGLSRQ